MTLSLLAELLLIVPPVVAVPRHEVDPELREDLEADREPRLTRICEVALELAATGNEVTLTIGGQEFRFKTTKGLEQQIAL